MGVSVRVGMRGHARAWRRAGVLGRARDCRRAGEDVRERARVRVGGRAGGGAKAWAWEMTGLA